MRARVFFRPSELREHERIKTTTVSIAVKITSTGSISIAEFWTHLLVRNHCGMSPKNKKGSAPSTTASATSPKGMTVKTSSISKDFQDAYSLAMKSYWAQISQNNHLKLIDLFCGFLVAVASIQCLFMIAVRDTFPFNAFLSGFIACVGQFVLLISLRFQIVDSFKGISKNRAFGEFILASLALHFICLHFIN